MLGPAFDDPMFTDPDRQICCAPSRYGYRCSLPIGHDEPLHVALATDLQPVDRWA